MDKTTVVMRVMAVVCLCLAATSQAADYKIKLARPGKKGETYRLEADGRETSQKRTSIGGRVVKQEDKDVKVHLDCIEKVLSVDKKGRQTLASITIRKFTVTVNGKSVKTLAPGRIVIAKAGEKDRFKLKDGEMPSEIGEFLDIVTGLTKDLANPSDDVMFGTTKRKSIGDTWSGNTAEMVKDMARSGITMAKEDISCRVKLVKAHKVDGVPCLRLSMRMSVKNIRPPLGENVKVVESTVETSMSADLPVDVAMHRLRDSERTTMKMRFEVSSPNGKVDIETTSSKTLESKTTPLKAGGT